MSKKQSLHLSQSQWEHLIQEQINSGLTIKQFCKNKNLTVSTFYSWRKKIESTTRVDKSAKASLLPMFVELEPKSEGTIPDQHRSCDIELQIGQHITLRMNH